MTGLKLTVTANTTFLLDGRYAKPGPFLLRNGRFAFWRGGGLRQLLSRDKGKKEMLGLQLVSHNMN